VLLEQQEWGEGVLLGEQCGDVEYAIAGTPPAASRLLHGVAAHAD
jgi:hypothetical protein